MNLVIDEELERIQPQISLQEYEQLKANIKRDGKVLDPIKVWGEIIIDGYNRYRIATELGVPFTVERLEFADRNEAIVWILEYQMGRRNLNSMQKTAQLALILKYQADGDTQAAADVLGVSRRTAQRDKVVASAAESLPKDVQERIISGNLAATKADLRRFASLEDDDKQKVITTLKSHPEKHFAEAMPERKSRVVLTKEDHESIKTHPHLTPAVKQRIAVGGIAVTPESLKRFLGMTAAKQIMVDDVLSACDDVDDLDEAITTVKSNFPQKTPTPAKAEDLNEKIGKQMTDLVNMFDALCRAYDDASMPYRDDCVDTLKLVRSRWNQWRKHYASPED